MKLTLYSLAFAVLSLLCLITSANAATPLPHSFRGLVWGQALEDFGEKSSMQDTSSAIENKFLGKNETSYKRLYDDNIIGGIKFTAVTYIFWRDKFKAITAYTAGSDKFAQLINVTHKKFGRPKSIEENQYCTRVIWSDKQTELVITMAGDDNTIHLYMKSLAIENSENRWEAAGRSPAHIEW
ncbi:hypothetical protein [Sporomusa aerivorans]|uniref:hypothetical protein n=1 Tax=Sporomusa aerivorans TaxID=204936 RepID=UPI00352B1DE2